jgi:hypothetical protein
MNEASGEVLSFADQAFRLLERVEHRVATSSSDREAAYRLRCEAYRTIGFLRSVAVDRLYDPVFDNDSNGWTTLTFVDGDLAGTVRVNVGFDERAVLPGLQAFADTLLPRLREQLVIVEFTRLAARLSLARIHPQLAYLIMRPAFMAAAHFDADFAVASPRAEHIPFYRRTFGAQMWCPPRDYPGLTARLACMAADYRAERSRIEQRFPFYKSTAVEREALFGRLNGGPISTESVFASTRRETSLETAAELPACA